MRDTTVDDIPWGEPPPEQVATAKPRRCSHPPRRRHLMEWVRAWGWYGLHDRGDEAVMQTAHPALWALLIAALGGASVTWCHPDFGGCGHVFDPAKQRQGRTSSRRGKDGERKVAKVLGGTRVGQFGGASDVDALFAIQVKAGPSYWPKALARLLGDHRLEAHAQGKAGPAVAYVQTGHRGAQRNQVIVAMYAEDLARALAAATVPDTEQEAP
jgi:hypothetical protein